MPVEKSAGAIIFRMEPFDVAQGKKTKFFYLLLCYPAINHRSDKSYWDFSKGHIEKGEELEDTVKREVEEETGLKDVKFIKGFKETFKYFFKVQDQNILKFVTFFLVETKEREVRISGEHIGYQWLSFEEAIKQLSFKNAKEILKKANESLLLKRRIDLQK